jgi:hypothetical protein
VKVVDVNLLLYAVNRDAEQHAAAKAWLDRTLSGTERVALPWIVVLAFLRLVTSPRVFAKPLPVTQALSIVDSWLERPQVVALAPTEAHWPALRALLSDAGTAGNLVTDAHLAALALEHEAELCSSDTDFRRFQGLKWTNPLRPDS